MNRKLFTTVACGAMLSVLAAAPALAQEEEEAQDDSRRLGAVTVTAQRTEQSQQDVPVAVTALDANILEDQLGSRRPGSSISDSEHQPWYKHRYGKHGSRLPARRR